MPLFTRKVLILLAGLLLAGCQQDQTESNAPPAQEARAIDPRLLDIVDPPSRPVEKKPAPDLKLLPSPLTSATVVVKAGLAGCSHPPRYSWFVNGRPVEEATGPLLEGIDLARGDWLEVEAVCEERTFTVAADVVNSPPRITSVGLTDPVLTAGEDIELVPVAEDPDGDLLDFRVEWRVDGEEISWITGLTLPGDQVKTGSVIELTVIPRDQQAAGPPFVAEPLTVPERPPRFTSTLPEAFEMQPFRYLAEAVDPDGKGISYRLEQGPEGMTIDASSGELTWTIPRGAFGEIPVRIVARDGDGQSAVQEFTLQLKAGE